MTLDARARSLAHRLIDKFGKVITYTSVSDVVYDPSTGTATPNGTAYTVKALVEDFMARGHGANSFDPGTMIRAFDKSVTIAASDLAVTPMPKDKIAFDTFLLTVIRVTTTYSGDLAAMYVIHCSE